MPASSSGACIQLQKNKIWPNEALESYHTGMYEPGTIIGHEFAGEVAAVGAGVDGWTVGDRVTANDALSCGQCPSCQRGQPTLCESVQMPGITMNGGMAEYVALPAALLHRLPEGVTMQQGALIEPLAVALHGVRRSKLAPGDQPLVIGAGPIGLLTLQGALLAGAWRVFVAEVNPARAALAEQLGAFAVLDPTRDNLAVELGQHTLGAGPSVVYVCSGAPRAFEDAFTLVGKGGQIVVLGLAVEPVAADFLTVVLHELDVCGSYLGCEEFPAAIDAVAQGRVNVDALISHEVALEDVVTQGFAALETPGSGAVKVLVNL